MSMRVLSREDNSLAGIFRSFHQSLRSWIRKNSARSGIRNGSTGSGIRKDADRSWIRKNSAGSRPDTPSRAILKCAQFTILVAPLLSVGVLSELAMSPATAAQVAAADGDSAVAPDEEPLVGSDEDEVIGVEETAAPGQWQPPRIEAREKNGRTFYSRQSSDAFADPDKPMELEVRYCFALGTEPVHVSESLSRGADPKKDLARLQVGLFLKKELGDLSQTAASGTAGAAELEWVDYNGIRLRRKIAVLRPDAGDDKAALGVYRAGTILGTWRIDSHLATRTFPASELPATSLPGGLLDTWDIPADAGARAGLYGRVIAVLKHIDGRYAVDFYGEALHKDSDCRVWLSGDEHPWGVPVAIRFTQVPVRRPSGDIAPVAVLAVVYQDEDDQQSTIAFDYPLCRPVMIQQMQALADRLIASGNDATQPDLGKLLGDDLLDELSRRLVNGNYRLLPN